MIVNLIVYFKLSYGILNQVMVFQRPRLILLLQFLIQINMKGKRICSYNITNQLLGTGAFSQVYLGYSHKQEKVAVKIIPRDKIKDNQLQVFQTQIKLLNNCKNQNIINFIDVKKTKANFYIFLQYCEDGNLADYIAKNKKIQQKEAMRIFSQLVKGMNAMKKMNIIHRDLKPANIMLKGNIIKIIDFGLARKYSKGQMFKTFAGTPLNMAPQILKGELYNQKADVYSAGTILYQMLFGILPYDDKSREGLLRKIQNRSGHGLPHFSKKIKLSHAVKQLLIKMLQPNPQKRIDFTDLLIQVKKWQNNMIVQKLNSYKRICASANPYMAIIGGLSSILKFQVNNPVNLKSVYDMDLKLCGKLSHRLICKQLQWLGNIQLVRV